MLKQASLFSCTTQKSWLYRRQITVKAPPGSFDQWSVVHSVFGMTVPATTNAGYGFGGIGDEGGLFYQPLLQTQDTAAKEGVFHGGKPEEHPVCQGEFALPR